MKRLVMMLALSFLMLFTAVPVATAAYNPLDDACEGVTNSPTCDSADSATGNPLTGTDGVILQIANLVSLIAGIIAVIILIIAGIQYMTAAGDSQKAANARRAIIGAIIGIAVIVAARFIVTIVVKGVS